MEIEVKCGGRVFQFDEHDLALAERHTKGRLEEQGWDAPPKFPHQVLDRFLNVCSAANVSAQGKRNKR